MPSLERTTSAGRAARLRGTFFLGALLAALVPAAVDCGGGDDDDGGGPGAGFNCADAYGARCGMGCVSDTTCGAGMFCGGGTCTAQCSGGSGCASGQTCSTQGRCVGSGTGGSGTGGSGGGLPPINTGGSGGSGPVAGAGGAGGECAGVSVAFRPIVPAVMLVLDRSASMNCHINREAELYGTQDCPATGSNPDLATEPESRWLTFKEPLLDVVNQVQNDVIFGSIFYPSNNGCAVTVDQGGVSLAVENIAAIRAKYDALPPPSTPVGGTPTRDALALAIEQLNSPDNGLPPNTPKFILLASDGSPTCTGNSQATVLQAVQGAFTQGINTFVFAIGELFNASPGKQAEFQALANAGVGFNQPNGSTTEGKLYFASDREALERDLLEIINGARPCSFDLDKALDDPATDGPRGSVTINGAPVPFNTPDGWKLTDNDTIEFTGAACTSIRQGSTDIKASFPCDVQTTPVPPPPPLPR